MKIETIRLINYKTFKKLELKNLPELVVFVGSNGTGKTTLFDVFSFLQDAFQNNIKIAFERRGGFNEVVSRGVNKNALIKIELQFRLNIANQQRLVSYLLHLGANDNTPYIEREILRYKRSASGSPFHFLDFARGKGYAVSNEEDFSKTDEELDRERHLLGAPNILATKGLGQFERFKAANAFRKFIENWHMSNFFVSEAKISRETNYAERLSISGDNLPLIARHMKEHHGDRFAIVLEKMRLRVPSLQKVAAATTVDGRVVLQFHDGAFQDPFIGKNVSDGTIKMFAYLLLLHEPAPQPLLCIEEPENQLYPFLLDELIKEFRAYARAGGQVFLTSHSPNLLDACEPEEVCWMEKRNGYACIQRASDRKELTDLYKAGELMGQLWQHNYFEGCHP